MNTPETVPQGRARVGERRYPAHMASRRSLRLTAFVLAAGLVGVACGGSSDGSEAASDSAATAADESPETAPPESSPPESSPEASADASEPGVESDTPSGDAPEILQFTGTLVGGGELEAAELSGKPTAFWFWSPT